MAGSLDVWITSADEWEKPLKVPRGQGRSGSKYNKNKGDGDKYNKNKGDGDKYNKNKDDGDNDGYRKKRSASRVRFPVRHFPNYRQFPRGKFQFFLLVLTIKTFPFIIERFPPLLSIFPWLPIFYDEITYQTLIFSPTGGSK
jgi:hypothetical protein